MAQNSLEIESRVSSKRDVKTSSPVYFLSLTVENVRCFGSKQTLDLSDGEGRPSQWTVMLGNNGVGKTTILQSLAMLAPSANPALSEFLKSRYEPALQDPKINFIKSREVVYPKYLDSPMYLNWNYYRHQAEFFYLSGAFSVSSKLNKRQIGKTISNFHLGKDKEGSLLFSATDYTELPNCVCFGYGASRRMGETSLSEKSEDNPYASLFSENVELLNAEEWLLQADYAASKPSHVQRRAAKRRDDIKDVLVNLLPDVEDIRFARLTEKQMKPGVEVKTPYGWVSIKDLSLGYKTLIAWMVDLASRLFDRYPDSPNPLAEPAVVLVDEIDLHLHPKWQRNLMSFLSERFPNTQFIATAHSPLVVQAATDANIVLLRREGDHVVIDNNVKAIQGWRVDQVLTSDLFGLESARPPQLDKLLAERTKILSKARLTKRDKEKLERIEAEIGELPTGETPEDIEAMDVIRRAAARLKAEGY
ncbi:MAG: AAA family ATPase [Pyrinomonadaceae bacterium]